MNNNIIPIFFACDSGYIKYTMVSLQSVMENASKDYIYNIHILNSGIEEEKQKKVLDMANNNFHIYFNDVSQYLEDLKEKLPIRDYYSCTTYYRLFLAKLFPEYDKGVYIDSDTIVLGDISELYNYPIGINYVGAAVDQVISQTDLFGEYAEKVLDINRRQYFNAGVLVINIKQFRDEDILKQFTEFIKIYTFVVAQDQDYLNILCEDKVYWIDPKWNAETYGELPCKEEDICLIHYNLGKKPWHYPDCKLGDRFWEYAKKSPSYGEIVEVYENYSDEERKRDLQSGDNLANLAFLEINNEKNFKNVYLSDDYKAEDRIRVLDKIAELEYQGKFDVDVEDDPPSKILMPDEIDYFDRSFTSRFFSKYAFKFGRWFLNAMLRTNKLIIKDIQGIENFSNLESGAIVTCNHFSPMDSFAMEITYDASEHKNRKLYRVIKEGNYTNFPGFYGYLMRHCNTLPLSSNTDTMKKFIVAIDELLKDGNFILIYPEQSMWWNYRKPKPLKTGAYKFAARNHVPVLPCFITMQDSDIKGEDGFYIQEYTIHIEKPIYPVEDKSIRENADKMMELNYECWKKIYEDTYQIPLTYTCGQVNYKGKIE